MAMYTKHLHTRLAQRGSARPLGLAALGKISAAFFLNSEKFITFLGLAHDPVFASLQQAASAARVIGVAPATAEAKQALGLQIDQRALSLIDYVQQGLGRSPTTGARLKVDPAGLNQDVGRMVALTGARAPLVYVLSRVSDGQRSLEAWLGLAQGKILVQVFSDLADPTIAERDKARLLIDADEILQDEQDRLQSLVDAREAGTAQRGQHAGALAQAQQFHKLLQTMAAVRNNEEVSQQDLSDMAYFYAGVLEESDLGEETGGATAGTGKAKPGQPKKKTSGGGVVGVPVGGASAASDQRHQRRG